MFKKSLEKKNKKITETIDNAALWVYNNQALKRVANIAE